MSGVLQMRLWATFSDFVLPGCPQGLQGLICSSSMSDNNLPALPWSSRRVGKGNIAGFCGFLLEALKNISFQKQIKERLSCADGAAAETRKQPCRKPFFLDELLNELLQNQPLS